MQHFLHFGIEAKRTWFSIDRIFTVHEPLQHLIAVNAQHLQELSAQRDLSRAICLLRWRESGGGSSSLQAQIQLLPCVQEALHRDADACLAQSTQVQLKKRGEKVHQGKAQIEKDNVVSAHALLASFSAV